MVAMTASWTVPASGAQFPFGLVYIFIVIIIPFPILSLPVFSRSYCLGYTYAIGAYVYQVPGRHRRWLLGRARPNERACTCTSREYYMVYSGNRAQSVPRSGGRASSGCPLQWAKPARPAPRPSWPASDVHRWYLEKKSLQDHSDWLWLKLGGRRCGLLCFFVNFFK